MTPDGRQSSPKSLKVARKKLFRFRFDKMCLHMIRNFRDSKNRVRYMSLFGEPNAHYALFTT